MKTSELTGAALDWAVAKCGEIALVNGCVFTKDPDDEQVLYSPSTNWAQGGPIIEREGINLRYYTAGWEASYEQFGIEVVIKSSIGPTPLVVAMRCFVASRLGDEVEIPPELA